MFLVDYVRTLDLMTANWSSWRVLVVVGGGGGLFTLMTGSNDDNDICIVNVPLQQQQHGVLGDRMAIVM